MEILRRASQWSHRVALIDKGIELSYGDLLARAGVFADALGRSSAGERVVLALPWTASYVVAQWGCWIAGATPVPVNMPSDRAAATNKQLAFVIRDSKAKFVSFQDDSPWSNAAFAESSAARCIPLRMAPDGLPLCAPKHGANHNEYTAFRTHEPQAFLLYTSGTTGKPKGVPWSQNMMLHNIRTLVDEWQWTRNDHILNVLPLHHVHGLINVVGCGLFSGAKVEMVPKFKAQEVWEALERTEDQPTLFMGVPTMYHRLLQHLENSREKGNEWYRQIRQLRLFVSGSAPLPTSIFRQWETLFGQQILERYGMTETGMILSNRIESSDRKPGVVGYPLPSLETKIEILKSGEPEIQSMVGELLVKGPGVFSGYWNRPSETARSFDDDGFFRTGDVVRILKSGEYQILGRLSSDIIKCGGEKISALELEHAISEHPHICECAVVRDGDYDLGEIPVLFAVSSVPDLTLKDVGDYCLRNGLLSSNQLPRRFKAVQHLPRNAMGKIDKGKLLALL